jgi:phosphoribosylaminoimidazole carboxylase (NCAIR synthetase)
MTCLAAANLGYKTCIYSDDKLSPAFQVASSHFIGSYENQSSLSDFAKYLFLSSFSSNFLFLDLVM